VSITATASARLLWALRTCFPSIRHVWADSGYVGQLVTRSIQQLRLTVQVVTKLTGQTTVGVLHRRRAVERTFSWISRCRRTVRDYERLPQHHAAMVQGAMIIIVTRRMASKQPTRDPCCVRRNPPGLEVSRSPGAAGAGVPQSPGPKCPAAGPGGSAGWDPVPPSGSAASRRRRPTVPPSRCA
jgi:transposase